MARSWVRILAWAAVAALVLASQATALIYLVQMGGLRAAVVSALLALGPVPLYVLVALGLDRLEGEPPLLLAAAFLWGAAVALPAALTGHLAVAELAQRWWGPDVQAQITRLVAAPILEEPAKGLALVILLVAFREEFDGLVDGVAYAAMVGLGFAAAENAIWYSWAAAREPLWPGSMIHTFVGRGLETAYIHPLFTALTGAGLGLARQTPSAQVRRMAPWAGLAMAMLLHCTYNDFGATPLYLGLVILPALATLGGLVALALAQESRVLAENLLPFVQEGCLSAQEAAVLSSMRGRLAASARAWRRGGLGAYLACERFQQAATRLAFGRHRAGRGGILPERLEPEEERCKRRLQALRPRFPPLEEGTAPDPLESRAGPTLVAPDATLDRAARWALLAQAGLLGVFLSSRLPALTPLASALGTCLWTLSFLALAWWLLAFVPATARTLPTAFAWGTLAGLTAVLADSLPGHAQSLEAVLQEVLKMAALLAALATLREGLRGNPLKALACALALGAGFAFMESGLLRAITGLAPAPVPLAGQVLFLCLPALGLAAGRPWGLAGLALAAVLHVGSIPGAYEPWWLGHARSLLLALLGLVGAGLAAAWLATACRRLGLRLAAQVEEGCLDPRDYACLVRPGRRLVDMAQTLLESGPRGLARREQSLRRWLSPAAP
ncbi:MAG TPA: PrsW family intramembrane metalloprotease [Candidatus Nitrosotenuis sp.]|nr:PrsW family intramembrane metalloprotease [Candidatus Nitrosotenuis sp.]